MHKTPFGSGTVDYIPSRFKPPSTSLNMSNMSSNYEWALKGETNDCNDVKIPPRSKMMITKKDTSRRGKRQDLNI